MTLYYDITVVRKEAASWNSLYLNFLSNTVSLVSSLFVFFAVAIVLSSLLIKSLLILQSNLDCACTVVYSTDSPSSFSVYSFVRICEVSD